MIRDIFDSVESYRRMLRPLNDPDFDASFVSQAPTSTQRFIDLAENLIYAYNPADDGLIRNGLRQGKDVIEIITKTSPFNKWFEGIDQAIAAEQRQGGVSDSGAGAGGGIELRKGTTFFQLRSEAQM